LEGYAWDNPLGPTTGGLNGKIFTVTTDAGLTTALAHNSSSKTIYLDGTFHPSSRLAVGSNISLIGKGKGANILGKGLNIYNATNVIIRNVGIRFVVGNDGMTIQNSTRVWIDHCEFESEFSVDIGPDYYVSGSRCTSYHD
jgi:pectate lyase